MQEEINKIIFIKDYLRNKINHRFSFESLNNDSKSSHSPLFDFDGSRKLS